MSSPGKAEAPGPGARNAELRRLASGGASVQELADRFGISRQRAHQLARAEIRACRVQLDENIRVARRKGQTLRELAAGFRVGIERVKRVCAGIPVDLRGKWKRGGEPRAPAGGAG